ncbi:MAG: hypothetical protein OEY49_02460 [Candidatus Heimdallarchaeota archaeon]|nr:hypothetical protein [Candidatus Heimdallarchaeota archaeon]
MNQKKLQALLVLIIISIAFTTYSSIPYTPPHSIYNNDWNGSSMLKNSLEEYLDLDISRFLISPLLLETKKDIKFVTIIGSERIYTQAEINAYKKFVASGGFLLIFEDFGPSKAIAEAMGIQFLPGVLKETSENHYINRPSQFFIYDLIFSFLFPELDLSIVLLASEAAGIIDLEGMAQGITMPILLTSPSVFLDTDNNNILDSKDLYMATGTPVGLLKFVGDGFLAVISDSSIPLNQYWNKELVIGNRIFTLPNAFWTLYFYYIATSLVGTTSVVFDESHQGASLSSAAGLFNLITGTWVGLLNTIWFVSTCTIIIGFYAYRNKRNNSKRTRNKNIGVVHQVKGEDSRYISNPNLTELLISEQYILYQKLGNAFIHVANSDLITKLKKIGRGSELIVELENKYGALDNNHSFEHLLEIHINLRNYIDENYHRWI